MKYGNTPCEANGQKYRSKREMRRHFDLMLLERAGSVADLKREVPFVLAPPVKLGGRTKPQLRYFADFVYLERVAGTDEADGVWRRVVEDAKGVRTPVYRVKRHLMAAIHGIEIRET